MFCWFYCCSHFNSWFVQWENFIAHSKTHLNSLVHSLNFFSALSTLITLNFSHLFLSSSSDILLFLLLQLFFHDLMPSSSSHSKPFMRSYTRHLECFVLRSLESGFEWLEELTFGLRLIQTSMTDNFWKHERT